MAVAGQTSRGAALVEVESALMKAMRTAPSARLVDDSDEGCPAIFLPDRGDNVFYIQIVGG